MRENLLKNSKCRDQKDLVKKGTQISQLKHNCCLKLVYEQKYLATSDRQHFLDFN